MPNTVQHALWPTALMVLGASLLLGSTYLVWGLAVVLSLPMAYYSALPDLIGVWYGSSPGFWFKASKGNWAGYSSAHHGAIAAHYRDNLLYGFHLWQDRFSHGDPDYTYVKNQSFWWDLINDILVVATLLLAGLGVVGTAELIGGFALALYLFKLYAWWYGRTLN